MFVVIAAPLAQADPAAAARALLGLRARFDGDYPLAPDAADSGDVRALTPSPRAALETVLLLGRPGLSSHHRLVNVMPPPRLGDPTNVTRRVSEP